MNDIDAATRTEIEAAAFRRLVAHLRQRTDVQNIDLMNLAGFCRNCLSNWIEEAARERGLGLSRAAAREHVYGMPYEQWRAAYQTEATPAQAAAFTQASAAHGADDADPTSNAAGQAASTSGSFSDTSASVTP